MPVSLRLLGMSFVCSIVELMSSSKSEILTDWASACERASFVLRISSRPLRYAYLGSRG